MYAKVISIQHILLVTCQYNTHTYLNTIASIAVMMGGRMVSIPGMANKC